MPEFLKDLNAWELLKQVIFFFYLALFIWGGSNKFGKKLEFNDDHTSLEAMKSLRGFAAIGVILHHISQENVFQSQKVLSPFVNAGAYFVAIFFFCSGYGLIKSLDTKQNYLKGFIRNRIVKAIVVPFYVDVLIYGLLMYFAGYKLPKERWIFNALGLTMMNEYAWFPIVLAFLYLAFFLCFRFIKNRPVCLGIILLFIIGLGIGFCYNGHFAWWHGENNWWLTPAAAKAEWWQAEKALWFNGEWWVNSAPAFFTGLVFASYEKHIVAFFKKAYIVKFLILLAITMVFYKLSSWGQAKFGYWTEWNGAGPGIAEKMKTYFCQVPLFLFLVFAIMIFMMKYHVSNPVTRFFGKYSLHTYLMNLAALTALRFLQQDKTSPIKAGKYDLLIYAVAVIAASVLLGVAEQKLTWLIQKLLFRKKKDKAAKAAT